MSQRPAAVVFDVDGTLVDSERHGHRVAFNAAFADAGLPHRWNEDRYGRLLAVPGGERRIREFLLGEGYPAPEAEELAARLHAHKTALFRDLAAQGRIPARPGTERLLDELAEAGTPVAVATTGSRAWVEPLLDRLFGLSRFVTVVAGDDVPALKPAPAAYHAVLDRLGEPADAVVAIEDSANGVAAARKAGVACLAVVNDYTAGDDLEGAALVVDRFGEPGRARVLAGPSDALERGAVTLGTLRRLLV
ncbi:MAG TPA: HAD-IA family hydrolase [Egibacteraceae bacterium]|nr:HAD-IA family hydrolase [Egibacteraceae bacterium]